MKKSPIASSYTLQQRPSRAAQMIQQGGMKPGREPGHV